MGTRTHSRCPLQLISDLLHITVRLARCVARYRRGAIGIAEGEGQAALPDEDGADLPATDYPIHPRVDVAGEHLVSPEGQLPQGVRRERTAADGLIGTDNSLLVPGGEIACGVCPSLVRVIQVQAETLSKRLGKFCLQGVVVSVLVVSVVADALGPAASASGASGKCAVGVTLQQRGVGRAAVGRNSRLY